MSAFERPFLAPAIPFCLEFMRSVLITERRLAVWGRRSTFSEADIQIEGLQ